MRAFLLTLLLTTTIFAGCLSDDQSDAFTLVGTDITVPEGARLLETAEGLVMEWVDVPLPFSQEITIPEGVTRVTATAEVGGAVGVNPYMYNSETDRRRCNLDSVHDWDNGIGGRNSCSGLAAIDPPGTNWTVRVTSGLDFASSVTVTFSDAPLDGIVADLDLSRLSMPTHDLETTQVLDVASFDGTPLRVEITLPEGEGPWPTVIASSPYNGQTGRFDGESGTPAMWGYFTHDWAKRGYAIVNVDVRGFGLSGGCVEIWGEAEQKDQAFIVDWVSKQDWSDSNIGFYGQSYVGTTPLAAASLGAPELDAIIAVAPVVSAYEDWHFGGVPNGENSLSPVAYQVLTDMPGQGDPTDPATILQNSVKGICDPTIVAEANDPRHIYNEYYEERNFKKMVDNIKAATLYTQGFYDSNVKSAMATDWFNHIDAPKLGLFGPWVHQHPTRADEEILFLGWMDQYVKGEDLGFDKIPAVHVKVDEQTVRSGDSWPPTDAVATTLYPDSETGRLGQDAIDGTHQLFLDGTGETDGVLAGAAGPTLTVLRTTITEDTAVAGTPTLELVGHLEQAPNAHVAAYLYDTSPEGRKLISFGMFNIAHREGHDQYAPVQQGELVEATLPMLPVEHIFREGHTLELRIRAAQPTDWAAVVPGGVGHFMLHGGADGVRLDLPSLDPTTYEPLPHTATK